MRDFSYPATLTADDTEGGYVVTFPDIPEAITQGEDVTDALFQAADALDEAIAGRIRRGDELPVPSKPVGEQRLVSVPMETAVTAARYLALREAGGSDVEIAGWPEEFWEAFGKMPDDFERPRQLRPGHDDVEP